MANWKREEQSRREGMAYALTLINNKGKMPDGSIDYKKGVEALQRDIKMRGATQLPIAIHPDTVNECLINIKNQVFDTIYCLFVLAILDEYKQGSKYQLKKTQRIIHRFEQYTDVFAEDKADWAEALDEIATRTKDKIMLQIRLNNVDAVNHAWTRENHRKAGSV